MGRHNMVGSNKGSHKMARNNTMEGNHMKDMKEMTGSGSSDSLDMTGLGNSDSQGKKKDHSDRG